MSIKFWDESGPAILNSLPVPFEEGGVVYTGVGTHDHMNRNPVGSDDDFRCSTESRFKPEMDPPFGKNDVCAPLVNWKQNVHGPHRSTGIHFLEPKRKV